MCCIVQTFFQQKLMTTLMIFMIEDVIGILGTILLFLYEFRVIGSNTANLPIRDETDARAVFIAVLVATEIICAVDFIMNIYVWIAASKGDPKKCKFWLIYSEVAVGLSAVLVVLAIVMVLTGTPDLSSISTEIPCRLFLMTLIHFCLRAYGSYAMKYLITDITQHPDEYRQTALLQDSEIEALDADADAQADAELLTP